MMNPSLAAQFQRIGQQESNPKLAFAASTMTIALLGMLLFRELSHTVREEIRQHERRQSTQPDRRRGL